MSSLLLSSSVERLGDLLHPAHDGRGVGGHGRGAALGGARRERRGDARGQVEL